MKKQASVLLLTLLASTGFSGAVSAEIYDHKSAGGLAYFRSFPLADRGYGFIKQQRYAEAVPLFERAIEIMPKNIEYRIQLVNLLVRTENYTRAADVLSVGMEQMPNNVSFIALQQIIDHALTPPKAEPVADVAWMEELRQMPDLPVAEKKLIDDVLVPAAPAQKPAQQKLTEKVKTFVAPVAAIDPCQHIGLSQNLSAAENLAAGYCALEQNNTKAATTHFSAAAKGRGNTAVNAQKQLGFIYDNNGNAPAAGEAWQYVANHGDAADIAYANLMLARNYRTQKQLDAAAESFAAVNLNNLYKGLHSQYYDEGAFLADARGDIPQALSYGEQSLALSDEPVLHYYQALRLQKANQPEAAIEQLEQAHAGEPDNYLYAITLAYAYRGLGQNSKAVPMFRAALESKTDGGNNEDFAYALKDESLRQEAAQQFRIVLPQTDDAEKAYDLRREIQQLEDRWQSVASLTYRDGIARAAGAPGVQSYDDSLQYGFETVYSPENWQRHGRKVQLYAQAFASSDPNRTNFNSRSTQTAIGIRATPLADVDWFVYAAKLVAIGDDALNDWQLRSTYGYTDGFDLNPNKDSWRYLFLAPDVSYLTNRQELFATLEGRAGQSFRHNNWVFTPHAVAAAAHQKNRDTGNDAVEVGVGISTKFWFAQSEARAPRGSADLIIQWREPIGGSDDKGGPFVRFVVQY